MAVAFVANSWQLANWGFSAGDIAVLAGAGRSVITWLSASGRDRVLLDFLKTTSSDLGIRRGLIDPIALNKRWSKKIVLFRNGERCVLEPTGKKLEIENIESPTWVMTIIVACLDVVVSNSVLRTIVVDLVTRIFEESTVEIEYLQHEIPEHIEGWRSTACIRSMVVRAQHTWKLLEEQRFHLPGFAPAGESEEIVEMLLWIVTGESFRYSTSSSDAFCLAILLQDLGFDLLRTGRSGDTFDEAHLVVIFDTSVVPRIGVGILSPSKRHGMRIPLQCPEECVSLWPGPLVKNNHRRQNFVNGLEASADIRISTELSDSTWKFLVSPENRAPPGRGDQDAYRLARNYLLLETENALTAMLELIQSWRIEDSKERGKVVRCLERRTVLDTDKEYLADLQVFLLGYYYGVLIPHVDTSQLSSQEAFGSWTWYDLDFLERVVKVANRYGEFEQPNSNHFSRDDIMSLVALLFAGAESHQLEGISSFKYDTYGLVSKLTLLSASLLGKCDTPDKVAKFVLLEIDPTSIPSNSQGVIRAAQQAKCAQSSAKPFDNPRIRDLNVAELDFTSHIQPAWGIDPDQCLLTYRHHGRLVHKVHPGEVERAVLKWSYIIGTQPERDMSHANEVTISPNLLLAQALSNTSSIKPARPSDDNRSRRLAEPPQRPIGRSAAAKASQSHEVVSSHRFAPELCTFFQASLSDFHGGNVVIPGGDDPSAERGKVLLIPSRGLQRARCCIAAMYKDHVKGTLYYQDRARDPVRALALAFPLDKWHSQFGEDLNAVREQWRNSFPGALSCKMETAAEETWLLVLL